MVEKELFELFSLRDHHIIVTGGSGLFGFPMSEALARAGATVVIASRNAERNEQTAEALRSQSLDVHSEPLDLADEESILAFYQHTVKTYGRIDVLVNNAVLRPAKDFWKSTSDQWKESARANITGMHLLTRVIAEGMLRAKSGNIINISSIYGIVGPVFPLYKDTNIMCAPDYAFHRGGIIAYTRYLATLLAPNVRVNCLSLGGLRAEGEDQVFVDRYAERCPLGRKAEEDDVKGPIIFLASAASKYMTGQNLIVDGGWTAW